jgi:hypothetical protein
VADLLTPFNAWLVNKGLVPEKGNPPARPVDIYLKIFWEF